MALDLSNLAPQDAIAALRSYPRRYRGSLEPVEGDDNFEALLSRPGPDGVSALDIASETAQRLEVIKGALDKIGVSDDPEIPAAAVDANAPIDAPTASGDLRSVIDRLAAAATGLADRAERVAAADWNRTGTVAGGGSVNALDVLREGVRVGADNLHRVDATVRAVRR